jgi:hypothetical protein
LWWSPLFTLAQDKTTLNELRAALFEAVFGTEAHDLVLRRRRAWLRKRHRPADAAVTEEQSSSSSSDSETEGGVVSLVAGTGDADDRADDVRVGELTKHRGLSFRGMDRVLRSQLRRGVQCLIVLDDCDGLLGQPLIAKAIGKILRDSPGVHVLTTTRHPLGGVPGLCTCICVRRCACSSVCGDVGGVCRHAVALLVLFVHCMYLTTLRGCYCVR